MTALVLIMTLPVGRAAADPLTIYVVNYPLQYFTQRIVAEHGQVVLPVPADVDPALWRPTPQQVIEYQRADLIVLNGAGYAQWVNRVALPQFRTMNTSARFKEDYITVDDTISHSHGPTGQHSHGVSAFTTWLDFTQAIAQAEAITQVLIKARPDQERVFTENLELLKQELNELDQRMLAAAQKLAGTPLLFSHPVYQYMERRYRLNGVSLHFEPDQEIAPEQWQGLDNLIERHPARWMVWEHTPLPATAKRLKEKDIKVIVFAPAANVVKTDFMAVMRENVRAFEGIADGVTNFSPLDKSIEGVGDKSQWFSYVTDRDAPMDEKINQVEITNGTLRSSRCDCKALMAGVGRDLPIEGRTAGT